MPKNDIGIFESMQNFVFEKRVTNIKQKYDFQNK